jgi:hypothetical protein
MNQNQLLRSVATVEVEKSDTTGNPIRAVEQDQALATLSLAVADALVVAYFLSETIVATLAWNGNRAARPKTSTLNETSHETGREKSSSKTTATPTKLDFALPQPEYRNRTFHRTRTTREQSKIGMKPTNKN